MISRLLRNLPGYRCSNRVPDRIHVLHSLRIYERLTSVDLSCPVFTPSFYSTLKDTYSSGHTPILLWTPNRRSINNCDSDEKHSFVKTFIADFPCEGFVISFFRLNIDRAAASQREHVFEYQIPG